MLRFGLIPAGALALVVLTGCSHHSSKLSRPTVNATGPIISATPNSGRATQAPSGAEGASTVAAAPCPLASAATVTAAFGGRIATQNISTTGKTGQQCQFTLANSNLGPGVTLYLSRNSPITASAFAATKKTALAHGSEAVSGVGQDAYYTASAHTLQYFGGGAAGGYGVTSTNPAALSSLGGQVKADLIALAKRAIAEQ